MIYLCQSVNAVGVVSIWDTRALKIRSQLATMTQIFYVVNRTFEMGCMLDILFTNDDRKKMTKNTSLSSSANGS